MLKIAIGRPEAVLKLFAGGTVTGLHLPGGARENSTGTFAGLVLPNPPVGHTMAMGFRWAIALIALLAPAARSQTACNNTPAYSLCELTFELPEKEAAAHPNPYGDVDLRVEFRSPRRRTYAMPAFWDGARRLVV